MTRRPPSSVTRPTVVLLAVAALALLGAVGVAAAHGNHATATTQVSANGSVVVEQAVASDPVYLVLRADDGGDPGRVLGHRSLDRGRHTGVRVGFEDDAWANVSGNTTVWAVLHADDGDGEFDPERDGLLLFLDEPAGDRFTVRKGDAAANVFTAVADAPEGTVPVSEATLPQSGHLVAHTVENGTLGRPLGSLSLPAGRHTDLSLSLDRPANGSVLVAVHTDDGDGTFEPGADPVVRVAGDPVASRYVPTTRASFGVTTPTPGDDGGTTSADGAGFGVAVALVALLLVGVAVRR